MFFKKKTEIKVDDRLKHIAFIMDGNGRWAKRRAFPRSVGHKFGVKTLENIARACFESGIKYVTVYAFSTENWNRPKGEIDAIIDLLKSYIKKAKDDNSLRYIFLGDKSVLNENLRDMMNELEEYTKDNKNIFNIAFNYGGRAEIVNACNKLIESGKASVTEQDISDNLYTSHMPDPDLIIRTAGEYRVSNFLLWQCAYSEFYITKTLWPDFDKEELKKAIDSFYKRTRRFGGLNKGEE